MANSSFESRLKQIEDRETELIRKGAGIVGVGTKLSHTDFFIFGALRRTLAQARGFRDLITARNFPCAAAILRLQLVTAMRVNALSLVNDADGTCKALLDGGQFNRLKDREGNKMTDAFLRKKLAEEHPWIDPIYVRTSDFVHLSGTHFDVSIAHTDDDTQTVFLQISGHDPRRPDEDYFEAIDAFFEATKLAGMLLLACLVAHHQLKR